MLADSAQAHPVQDKTHRFVEGKNLLGPEQNQKVMLASESILQPLTRRGQVFSYGDEGITGQRSA